MKPVNIYTLSMARDISIKNFNSYYKYLSDKGTKSEIKDHEKSDLRKFVTAIYECDNDLSLFDGFYFSFTIPQISKEFDLIKITDKGIINIELKARTIDRKNILRQLRQNRHYCHHLAENIVNITCVAEKKQFFILNSGELQPISIPSVVDIMREFSHYKISETGIDKLFSPNMFLISPLNDSEAFIENEYFLTGHQERIKHTIITKLMGNKTRYFCLDGDAGTGKTLLLYDIAKEISLTKKVLVIHSGKLCNGHKTLTKYLDIHIVSDKDNFNIADFDVIFIDESHRMNKDLLFPLINSGKKLVFAIDSHQCTVKKELDQNIYGNVRILENLEYYKLTNTIRINKELSLFIKNIFNLKSRHPHIKYSNVEIMLADNENEFVDVLKYFKNTGYTFINYSDNYNSNISSELIKLSSFDTSDVTGQEFDKVVMYIDNRFYYDNGELKSRDNSDIILSKMLYQGVTRCRDKLALVIYKNTDIYHKLMDILIKNHNK